MNRKNDFLLYLISDLRFEKEKSMYDQIEEAIKGGVTMLQFRDKNLDDDKFLEEALKLRELTNKYNIPFLINDRVYIAKKCLADGVHIGRSDMSIEDARKILGNNVLIGSSVATVEEALRVEKQGADYVGVGAVFNTSTKEDTKSVSRDTLSDICKAIKIPAVAIGGVNELNVDKLKGSGISGIAVVSAILAKEDITTAAKDLKKTCQNYFL